jgi:hypothetical protein
MFRSALPANMDNAVLYGVGSFARPPFARVGYGSNLREISDARILDKVNVRRAERSQAKTVQPTKVAKQVRKAEEKAYDESLEDINKQLAQAQRRRALLEEELEKAKAVEADVLRKKAKALEVKKNTKDLRLAKEKMVSKRKEAFARKLGARGGKPTGIVKSVSPKQIHAPITKLASPKTTPTAAYTGWGTGPVHIRYRPYR